MWIKIGDKKPNVGDLIITRDEGFGKFEYNAGIVEGDAGGLTISIAYGEYKHGLDDRTEWKKVEE